MHFLQYVFELAFIFICFELLWQIFLFLFKLVIGVDRKRNSTAYYILKAVSLYILTSLTIVVTFRHLEIHQGPFNHISYPIIGFIVLYLYIVSGMHKSRLKAQVTMNEKSLRRIRFNGLFLTSVILYYGIATYLGMRNEKLFISWILENRIVTLFFATINDIYDLLLFRIVIGFLAILLLFNMAVRGFLATRMLLFSFFGIPDAAKERMQQRFTPGQTKDSDEAEYSDYEIIDEDKKEHRSD